jgi:hypothetical protein
MSNLENYKIRREMIVHEDHQINSRIGLHLTTQSLLLTSVVLLINNQVMKLPVVALLLMTISTIGFLLGCRFHLAIQAARTEQDRIKGNGETLKPNYDDVFPLDENQKKVLQAGGTTLKDGFGHVPWVVLIMTAIWIPLFIAGVVLWAMPQLLVRTGFLS